MLRSVIGISFFLIFSFFGDPIYAGQTHGKAWRAKVTRKPTDKEVYIGHHFKHYRLLFWLPPELRRYRHFEERKVADQGSGNTTEVKREQLVHEPPEPVFIYGSYPEILRSVKEPREKAADFFRCGDGYKACGHHIYALDFYWAAFCFMEWDGIDRTVTLFRLYQVARELNTRWADLYLSHALKEKNFSEDLWADLRIAQGQRYFEKGQYEQAREFGTLVMNAIYREPRPERQRKARILVALSCAYSGKYLEALQHYCKLIEGRLPPRERGYILFSRAHSLVKLGQFDAAYNDYVNILRTGNVPKLYLARTHEAVGNIFLRWGKFIPAIRAYTNALNYKEFVGFRRARSLLSMGIALVGTNNCWRGKDKFQQALQFQNCPQEHYANTRLYLAEIHVLLKEYDESLPQFERILRMPQVDQNLKLRCWYGYCLSLCYREGRTDVLSDIYEAFVDKNLKALQLCARAVNPDLADRPRNRPNGPESRRRPTDP